MSVCFRVRVILRVTACTFACMFACAYLYVFSLNKRVFLFFSRMIHICDKSMFPSKLPCYRVRHRENYDEQKGNVESI